jgi:hypothetical protein
MRTTIRIDEALLQEAKTVAVRTGRSLSAVITDALRESLARQRAAAARPPVTLVTVTGNRLHPGVALDDSAGLLALLEATNEAPA